MTDTAVIVHVQGESSNTWAIHSSSYSTGLSDQGSDVLYRLSLWRKFYRRQANRGSRFSRAAPTALKHASVRLAGTHKKEHVVRPLADLGAGMAEIDTSSVAEHISVSVHIAVRRVVQCY